jgi:hypothetical protein
MTSAPPRRIPWRTPGAGDSRRRPWRGWLRRRPDRAALLAWALTRLALWAVALVGSVLAGAGADRVLQRWERWDVGLFRKVAEFGYDGYPHDYPDVGVPAFFPGLPLVLRAVHALVPDWTAAGLLVSFVAGAVAAVALSRLAEAEHPGAGPRAVTLLALSPYGVFLVAGYSEALFLAAALPAWLAARRGDWARAGLLAALATTVRVTGLFLAVALLVEAALAWRDGRPPGRRVGWLLAPFAAAGGYAAYLWTLTGDWLAWPHAQQAGWGRRLTDPVTSFLTTLAGATSDMAPEYVWSYRAEIVSVALGAGLTVWLLWRRRLGEAVYVGLSVLVLATSTTYLSVPRAALLWWPLWVGLAVAARRRRVLVAYLVAAVPLCVLLTLLFTEGRWVA